MTPTQPRGVAAVDLAEIDDHLRAMHAELRATGVPASAAVARAARELVTPGRAANDDAPFGTRLSRPRAYAAAALLLPTLLRASQLWYAERVVGGSMAFVTLQLAMTVAVVAGLVAQRTWARAMALGVLGAVVAELPWLATHGHIVERLEPDLASWLGAFALLAPWRRRELSAAGCAVALLGLAYGGVLFVSEITGLDSGWWAPVWGIAICAVLAAGVGTLLRARWAALTAVVAAVEIARMASHLFTLRFASHSSAWVMAGATMASLAAAVLAWRAAHSTFGTLRNVSR